MRRFIPSLSYLVICGILTIQPTFAQIQKPGFEQSTEWLRRLESPENPLDRLKNKNKLVEYSKFDFSTLIVPKTEFLGFIDPDFQRLKVYFDKVTKSKTDPRLYFVKGATVVKTNRCDFSGSIKITQIREYRKLHYGVDDEYKNKGITKQGVIVGAFRFKEDPKQKDMGIFEGVMTLSWYLDRFGKMHYDDIRIGTDPYRNNQYVSTWTQYGAKHGKVANWGEYRIPFSGDLDIGAAEFSVNPEYLSNGWQDYRTP